MNNLANPSPGLADPYVSANHSLRITSLKRCFSLNKVCYIIHILYACVCVCVRVMLKICSDYIPKQH
jgi:hypothetical protein